MGQREMSCVWTPGLQSNGHCCAVAFSAKHTVQKWRPGITPAPHSLCCRKWWFPLLCKQPLHKGSSEKQPQVTQIWHETALIPSDRSKFFCGWHSHVGWRQICNEASKQFNKSYNQSDSPSCSGSVEARSSKTVRGVYGKACRQHVLITKQGHYAILLS